MPLIKHSHEHHHHYHYSIEAREEVLARLDALQNEIGLILDRQELIMATMADLEAAVTRNTDVDESVLTLLAGISQQLKDAQGDPAKIADVIAKLDANTQKMADAVSANTPAA
jgi:chromosome segregation ATPase